jgi:hypothetical protein
VAHKAKNAGPDGLGMLRMSPLGGGRYMEGMPWLGEGHHNVRREGHGGHRSGQALQAAEVEVEDHREVQRCGISRPGLSRTKRTDW